LRLGALYNAEIGERIEVMRQNVRQHGASENLLELRCRQWAIDPEQCFGDEDLGRMDEAGDKGSPVDRPLSR
jgi:hypothetical protein